MTPQPARPVSNLPVDFWVQIFVGFFAWTVSASVWVFRPQEASARYLLLTGLSSREAMEAVRAAGGEVVAEAALVDRSAGSVDLGVPFFPLVAINFPTYAPNELPPELAGTQAVKPGSRSAAA